MFTLLLWLSVCCSSYRLNFIAVYTHHVSEAFSDIATTSTAVYCMVLELF